MPSQSLKDGLPLLRKSCFVAERCEYCGESLVAECGFLEMVAGMHKLYGMIWPGEGVAHICPVGID